MTILGALRCQFVVVLRVQRVDEIDLSSHQAKQLDIAILLDVETDGIDVGQLTAGRVVLPVIRIALQKQVGAGFVLRKIVGSEHRRLFLCVEWADMMATWSNSLSRPAMGAGNVTVIWSFPVTFVVTLPSPERKAVSGGRVQRRIHQLLHGVGNVLGGKRGAVGKAYVRGAP